jgi:hypothetical protein
MTRSTTAEISLSFTVSDVEPHLRKARRARWCQDKLHQGLRRQWAHHDAYETVTKLSVREGTLSPVHLGSELPAGRQELSNLTVTCDTEAG